MSVFSEGSKLSSSVQLILFVDDRSRGTKEYQETIDYLGKSDIEHNLKIVNVTEQPDLAEYFKLMATPTLVKLSPAPRQVFAGSNLLSELYNWLPNWQEALDKKKIDQEAEQLERSDPSPLNPVLNIAHIQEVLRLSDEVFKLRQQQAELQEQLRFKEQAIGILAHDLRNPLTAANLALDTLAIARNPDDLRISHLQPQMVQKLISRAKEQVMIVDRLISDILQLSLGSVAEITISPHRFNINKLLLSVIDQMNEPLHKKQQKVSTDIPQDIPPVYADAERIRQVLMNLLDNASKYTPVAGQIKVVVLHRTSQKVQVTIIDNGPGISEADYELVFQKYYRIKRDKSEDGYGLGLSLCKSIIRAHYGQIWVESSDRGSSFHFTLPVYYGR
jgi:two-component system, OmpR family, clock-associated histidine kinase SasA